MASLAGASLGQADVPSTRCVGGGGALCRSLGKEAAGNQTPVSLWL